MWIIKWEDERIIMKWTYLLENLVRLIYWTRRSDSLYLRPICINWISMYYGYNIHSLDPSFKLNSNKGVSSKRFDWAKRRSDARLSRCLEVPVVDARGRQGPHVGPQSHRQYIIIVYMLKKLHRFCESNYISIYLTSSMQVFLLSWAYSMEAFS